MKIGTVIKARTHAEFLNEAFGTDYKAWMKSVWNYDENSFVWMVRFNEIRDGWRNTFISNDCIMEENMDNKTIWGGVDVAEEPTLNKRRIVIEIIDGYYERKYIFRGVFEYDRERSNPYAVRYHNRVSDEF